jgi:hypothetical protein
MRMSVRPILRRTLSYRIQGVIYLENNMIGAHLSLRPCDVLSAIAIYYASKPVGQVDPDTCLRRDTVSLDTFVGYIWCS